MCKWNWKTTRNSSKRQTTVKKLMHYTKRTVSTINDCTANKDQVKHSRNGGKSSLIIYLLI